MESSVSAGVRTSNYMKKADIPNRIYKLHAIFARLGKPGHKLVKLLSLYSLYVIFTNGGVEALAVICHEYMLRRVNEEKITHVNASRTARTANSKN
jgi:hypothetical protein